MWLYQTTLLQATPGKWPHHNEHALRYTMMMASVFIGTCILQSNERICLVHMIIALCCAVKQDLYITFGNSDYRERKSLCTNKQKLSAMVHIPGKTVYRCGLTCHITVQLADVRDHKLQLAIVHTAILFQQQDTWVAHHAHRGILAFLVSRVR